MNMKKTNNYTVYIHENKINHKVYIGITSRPVEVRWGANGRCYYNSPYFASAIKKYGWDNFEHIIFGTCLSKESACNIEKDLIELYQSNNREYGYNQTSGGESGFTWGDLASEKLRNNMLNATQEHRDKISAALKGKPLTEETKRKLAEAHKWQHPTKEQIQKSKEATQKKTRCVELDIIFDSRVEAAAFANRKPNTITNAIQRKSLCGGYHWEDVEERNDN